MRLYNCLVTLINIPSDTSYTNEHTSKRKSFIIVAMVSGTISVCLLMHDTDGRRLDHKTLEVFRIRAVQRVMEGESPEVVVKALGTSRAQIYEWLAAYHEGGFEALKAIQISGRPKKLNGQEIRELYTWITTFTPDQLKFPSALWTVSAVKSTHLPQGY